MDIQSGQKLVWKNKVAKGFKTNREYMQEYRRRSLSIVYFSRISFSRATASSSESSLAE